MNHKTLAICLENAWNAYDAIVDEDTCDGWKDSVERMLTEVQKRRACEEYSSAAKCLAIATVWIIRTSEEDC